MPETSGTIARPVISASNEHSKRGVEIAGSIHHTLPRMAGTVFTLGYQERNLDDFVRILVQERIDVLVDVRETPWSHKPGFSKTPLASALDRVGIEYVHARFAGNPKRLRTKAKNHSHCLRLYSSYLDGEQQVLASLEDLLGGFLADGKRVCLTCFERHPADCHRTILAERWAAGGKRRVRHLATEGARRLA